MIQCATDPNSIQKSLVLAEQYPYIRVAVGIHPEDCHFITNPEAALSELCGERMQTPPVYSAKKIDGRRAYEYAREGALTETEPKMRQALINIYEMELLEWDMPRIKIRVRCSKGTYIRSIAMELGEKLESGAYLTSLCRTRSGGFTLALAQNLEKILENL